MEPGGKASKKLPQQPWCFPWKGEIWVQGPAARLASAFCPVTAQHKIHMHQWVL